MINLPSIVKEKVAGKTVLLRLDLNAPVEEGKVVDDFRLLSSAPTIKMLQDLGAKVVVLAHLGRPKGVDSALSLLPVAEKMADILGYKFVASEKLPDYDLPHLVFLTGDVRTEGFAKVLAAQTNKQVIILENIRFYPEEEQNDRFFASRLAGLGQVYVNDAFGVCHRAASSTVAITEFLESFAGPLLEKEVRQLSQVLTQPRLPFVLMMAGIKIDDKVATLNSLGSKADKIILGGGLANAIFQARGLEVGLSRVDAEAEKIASQVDKNFKDRLVLPEEVVVADKDYSPASIRAVEFHKVLPGERILDIGPRAIYTFSKILKEASTIVWNGPLGQFERRPFHHGTLSLARVVGSVGTGKAFVVVGGGETVDAVRNAGQAEFIDHLSTGGGAMLEFLAGKELPGLLALEQSKRGA